MRFNHSPISSEVSSMSAISAELKRVLLNELVSVLWTDDPTYAQYLASTFEVLWEQAVLAVQWIEELLKEESPQT